MTPFQRGYAQAEEEISGAYDQIIAAMEEEHRYAVVLQHRAYEVTSEAVSYDRGRRAAMMKVKEIFVTTKPKEFKQWLSKQ